MIIYKTTNLKNGKIYIGKSNGKDQNYLGSGIILNKAITKHGRSYFVREILEICSSTDVNSQEIFWINKFNSQKRKIGYNIARGGSGGDTISNHPNKINIGKRHSLKMRGIKLAPRSKMISLETRKKLSNAATGTKNGMFGKKHAALTREKISLAQKRRPASSRKMSESTKQKLSEALSDRKHSKETKLKISIANSGNNNPFFNKRHSEDSKHLMRMAHYNIPKSENHKKELSKSLKKFWENNYPTNSVKVLVDGIEYNSLTEASEITKINLSTLRNRCKSKNPHFATTYRIDSPKMKMSV